MIRSANEFRRLRTSDDLEEQRRATLEHADEDIWLEVIERFPDMREWVARNKTVPLSILRMLATDAEPRVRLAVAMKRKLDRELFERLAHDREETVRATVAMNLKVPRDLLILLAQDSDALVATTSRERIHAPKILEPED